jgi:hypothetical protein
MSFLRVEDAGDWMEVFVLLVFAKEEEEDGSSPLL